MKNILKFSSVLFLFFSFSSFGQFPEVQKEQSREILYNRVKKIKVFEYNYQNTQVDTIFAFFEEYDYAGRLIERHNFFSNDTTGYECELYRYIQDSNYFSELRISYMINPPTILDPVYQKQPRKVITEANDKGQIIFIKEFHQEGILKKRYSYFDSGLLKQIDIFIDNKIAWVYKMYYEYF